MTKLSFLFLFLLVPLITAHAHADEGVLPLRKLLKQQAAYLATLRTEDRNEACDARYERLWTDGTLRIDWFYGYLDTPEVIVDRMWRAEQARMLKLPCKNGLEGACGFKTAADDTANDGPLTLSRKLPNNREVIIRIWNSSTSDFPQNNTIGTGRFTITRQDQRVKTKNVWKAYLNSVKNTEVVIYEGHSRVGTGPGFGPFGIGQMVTGELFKSNWRKVMSALSQSTKKPELMMFSSCESQSYYLPALRRQVPGMAVAATKYEQSFSGSDQMSFSLVDSLVAGRCESDMNRAFHSVNGPKDGAMRVFGFDQ